MNEMKATEETPDRYAPWIEAIKRHALANYNTAGWDYVVETMSDDDIRADLIRGNFDGQPVTTEAEALACIGEICALLDERRRDISATAF